MPHLVLTRSLGERTTLTVPASSTPTEITIEPLDFRGSRRHGRVRLGFRAPQSVQILREEAKGKEGPLR